MFVCPLNWFYCPPDCPPKSGSTNNCCTGKSSSGCGCQNNNPIFIPGSPGCCGGGCNEGCGCNCQLCGTIFEKDYVGGCGPWCASCGGAGDGKGGCCPNPRVAYECYNNKAPKPWDYQILPTRYESGWTAEFWMRRNSDPCSGLTANTLNALYPDNEGFFYYMGTRAENKFWDVFSGETGYTTTSGYPLPPPLIKTEEELTNPFLIYQPADCCCFTGLTTVTTHERDRNADIVNNALGFRVKNDGSIGYRSLGVSGVCSAVTSTTVAQCCDACNCILNCIIFQYEL